MQNMTAYIYGYNILVGNITFTAGLKLLSKKQTNVFVLFVSRSLECLDFASNSETLPMWETSEGVFKRFRWQ